MTRARRGGYLLLEAVLLIPAAAVILILTTRLVNRAVAAHRIEQQRDADRGQIVQLTSFLRGDFREAEHAVVDPNDQGVVLRLDAAGRSIEYHAVGREVRRVEAAGDECLGERRWKLRFATADFVTEKAGAVRPMIWVRFVVQTPILVGEQVHRAGRDVSVRPTVLSTVFMTEKGGAE